MKEIEELSAQLRHTYPDPKGDRLRRKISRITMTTTVEFTETFKVVANFNQNEFWFTSLMDENDIVTTFATRRELPFKIDDMVELVLRKKTND